MQSSRPTLLPGLFTAVLLAWMSGASAAQVKQSLEVVSGTTSSAAASQKKIEQLAGETRALLEEYRRLQDGVEYQAAYTRELEQLEQSQRTQIEALQRQISEAAITRQRIVPLMRSMADALEKFVVLDLPFHHEERINAVLLLKQRLNQPDLAVSAKFRLLLELYQLEQGYGNSIESWRGPLQWQGEELSVEFLRIGRVALYFQSLDGASSGFWSVEQEQWLPLDPQFNRDIAQALRVARNAVAPELLQLPLVAPGDAS
jgi:cell division protein FtsB